MKRHLSILAALSLAFVAYSGTAKADNTFSLHLEPGLAQPLSAPQSNLYTTGMVLGAKGLFALDPYVSVGPSVSTLYLPRSIDDGQNAGTLWQFGASARVQAPREATKTQHWYSTFNPWIDLDAMLANTGNLQRPAFDLGVGAETPLDQNHIFWVGPFLRFTHVFQTADTQDTSLLDPRDVNILQAGISFSFDAPTKRKVDVVEHHHTVYTEKQVPAECPPPAAPPVAAPAPEKLAITQVVYFDHDSSKLRWESKDKLDAVVRQLRLHPNLTMNVEGHASSDGDKLHNVKLSGERTAAVLAYLIRMGVDPKRLNGTAHGIDLPAAPNNTQEGRERNRRVEFTVTLTSQ